MGCGCQAGRNTTTYRWTPTGEPEGANSIDYPTEIEAKAKVIRAGGSYRSVPV